MKKIGLLIALIFSVARFSFADTTNVYTNLKKGATEIVNGVTTDAKNVMTHLDSSFAELADSSQLSLGVVYRDLKVGIESMGKALKVGATHVYEVLVRQQIAKSILWVVVMIFTIVVLILAWKLSNGADWKEWNDRSTKKNNINNAELPNGRFIISVIFWIIGIISLIVVGLHLDTMVYGFVNPEYGAMSDIVDFINQIKNGATK